MAHGILFQKLPNTLVKAMPGTYLKEDFILGACYHTIKCNIIIYWVIQRDQDMDMGLGMIT